MGSRLIVRFGWLGAFGVLVLLAIPVSSSAQSLWGSLNYHHEKRDGQKEWNPSGYAGLDFELLDLPMGGLYAGPQVGLFRERVLTFSNDSRVKFSGGFRTLFRIQPPVLPFDFWPVITAEFLNGDDDDPVYFIPFVGAGISYRLAVFSLDFLAQYGGGPFFDDRPEILRLGLGASFHL